MAYRDFTDEAGQGWRVWDTYPQKPEIVAQELKSGWLSFESAGEKLRLAPVPKGWEEGAETELRGLLQAARKVDRGRSLTRGMEREPPPM